MILYKKTEWLIFRNEILRSDGHACRRCKRHASKEVILQIHHKFYVSGKMPWEYSYDACETLCKGCHASEHGLVRPNSGWECIGIEDLESLSGECQLCGQQIRYVFSVYHSKWPILEVGTICCDNLTGEIHAQSELNDLKNHDARRRRFVNSEKWVTDENGGLRIIHNNMVIEIRNNECFSQIVVDQYRGRQRFSTIEDAKKHVFKILETGRLEEYISTCKINRIQYGDKPRSKTHKHNFPITVLR